MNAQKEVTYGVLLVDDSEDDLFFLQKGIKNFPRFKVLQALPDGKDLVAYLNGEPPHNDGNKHPLPDLILLDLKMPHMTGHEVLRWLKTQAFPSVKVIVLSGSQLTKDVEASLAMGAHGFWSKTANAEKQRLIATEIEVLLDRRSKSIDPLRK